MIILHYEDIELWFEPDHIVVAVASRLSGIGSDVFTVDSSQSQGVRETPEEIARLKYAWGARHAAEIGLPETHKIGIELVDGEITARYGDIGIDGF